MIDRAIQIAILGVGVLALTPVVHMPAKLERWRWVGYVIGAALLVAAAVIFFIPESSPSTVSNTANGNNNCSVSGTGNRVNCDTKPTLDSPNALNFHMPDHLPVAGYIGVGGSSTFKGGSISGPEAGAVNFGGLFSAEGTTIIATEPSQVPEYKPNHKFSGLSNEGLKKKTDEFAKGLINLKIYFNGEFGLPALYDNYRNKYAEDAKELLWELGNRLTADKNIKIPDNKFAQATILSAHPAGKFSLDQTAKYFQELANLLPEK